MQSDYQKYYKSLPDFKLLKIVENKDAYEADAYAAALKELENRNISEEVQEAMKSKIQEDTNVRLNREKRQSSFGNSISDFFNFRKPKNVNQTIKILAIAIFLFGVYDVYSNIFAIEMNLEIEDKTFLYTQVFSLLIPIIGAILLWNKQSLGWYLSISYFTYNAVLNFFFLLIRAYLYKPISNDSFDLTYFIEGGFFQMPSFHLEFALYLLTTIFVFVLLNVDIRKSFRVNSNLEHV